MILQARWGLPDLCLFSGQGLHPCQRSSKRYHVCWASGELFLDQQWRKLLIRNFVCRVLERPPRALSSPITIKRRDGKRPLFAQILSGHLKTFVHRFLEIVILGLALTTNWSKMQPKQESLFMGPTQRFWLKFETEDPEWFILYSGWPCCYCKWWCGDVQRRGTELKQS